MKYITTEDKEGTLEIFTFPDSVNHDRMAEALSAIKNHVWEPSSLALRTPISAGFVNASGVCVGESVSLDLTSRGSADTDLLRQQN